MVSALERFHCNPFVSLFRQIQAGKRWKTFKEQPRSFPKTISPKLPKFATFLKIATCKQKYSQKYRYVKNGHLWDFGPKFRFFFSFFKCPIATSPLVVLRKIWSHFCPWTIGVGPWKLAFLSYFGQRKRHFFDSKHAKTAKIGKN